MKKQSIVLCILFIVLLSVSGTLSATTYYFSSSTGADSRTFIEAQSPTTPWKTISKFNEVFSDLEAGDVVLFRRGDVFRGGMVLDEFGTQNAPIVIGAYGEGEKPIISGFTTVDQWTSIGDGIYESNTLNTEVKVNMVVIDGVNYAVGRYPNIDEDSGGYLTMEEIDGTSVSSEGLSGDDDWDGGEMVMRSRHWILDRVPILTHSGTTINFEPTSSQNPREDNGFFIQRHIKTLDQFGEWYFNPGTQKIAIYFGSAGPDNAAVQVATIENLANIKGEHILIEDLSFVGANGDAIHNSSYGIANLQIRHCDISFSGGNGVHFEGLNGFTLENCTIRNSNNCGIKLSDCPRTTVRNNLIEDSAMQAGMGGDGDGNYSGILNDSDKFIAEYNRIINTGYIGLRFGAGDNLIKNNYIDTFCTVLDDGAGIYAYDTGGNLDKRIVIGNIVLNGIGYNKGTSSNDNAAEGIYLDDNVSDVQVIDNTIAWAGSHGAFIHNVSNFIIDRNTFFNNHVQTLIKSDSKGHPLSGGRVIDNIFFSKEASESVMRIVSDADDIADMGLFEVNAYVRPLNDKLPIYTQYQNSNERILRKYLEIEDWRSTFGHGGGSSKSPVQIDAYSIDNLLGENKIPNGAFNNGIGNFGCFTPFSDCQTDWDDNNVLDGGALEISGPSPSRAGISCGELKEGQPYVLSFSAAANQAGSMEIYFMQGDRPWHIVSERVGIQLSTEKQDYEVILTSTSTENNGTIQFDFGNVNTVHWLDNLDMREADLDVTDPDDYIRFEYNDSKQNKTFTLDGNYVDAKNKAYSGTVVLRPFKSLVLIRDLENQGNTDPGADADGDGVLDADDVCPDGDDNLDADVDGVPDACDSCPGFDDGSDIDNDGVSDGCDVCPGGDDKLDNDDDGIPDACDSNLDQDGDGVPDENDQCPGFDDKIDADGDGVPDACDQCPGSDDSADSDSDGVPNDCDICAGSNDNSDSDGDGVPNGCDVCPDSDDGIDSDNDGVPDGCDQCADADDNLDSDGDDIADGCDVCPGSDDAIDSDGDGIPDGCDICPGSDDTIDTDGDGVPNSCDICEGRDDAIDSDGDGIPNGCDRCVGSDDSIDTDDDGVPDGCDICPEFDDNIDSDGDGVPDGCDTCVGNDGPDNDNDGIPDACDICAGSDDKADSDGDGVPNGCDVCPGSDDALDTDGDGVPNGCDICLGSDDTIDSDSDGVPDGCDTCAGSNDNLDSDQDGVPNGCDDCAGADDKLDSDQDGVPDGCDICVGHNDNSDIDNDGVPNGCDTCAGADDKIDSDGDGVPDGCDICAGADDKLDSDQDGVPDDCDICINSDDEVDRDGDGVPDGCDLCPGSDDAVDEDQDGIPDACDDCVGISLPICESGDCPMNQYPIPRRCYEESEVATGEIGRGTSGARSQKPGNAKGGEEIETDLAIAHEQGLGEEKIHKWEIYPNPISNSYSELNIRFYTPQQEVQLVIIDHLGRTIQILEPDAEIGWNHLRWNTSQLSAGTYYLYHANAPAMARKAYPFVVIRN